MDPSFPNEDLGKNEKRATVKTRLLLLSDTHGALPRKPSDREYASRHPLPDAEMVLHAGDLTMRGYKDEYTDTINFLASHPAELKLVIAGNHDITLDQEYVLGPDGSRHGKYTVDDCRAVKEMWCSSEAKSNGIHYLQEGTYSFDLKNGSSFTIHVSPYQPIYDNWAFAYERHEDRFNPPHDSIISEQPLAENLLALAPNPLPGALPPFSALSSVHNSNAPNPVPPHPAVDILLTHGPPLGILDTVAAPPHYNVGCAHLLRAVERCKPLIHAFGHIHEGWGVKVMDWEKGRLRDLEIVRRQGGAEKESLVKERCGKIDLTTNGENGIEWGRATAFVNASIMNVENSPVNAPWVIDVDLPMKSDSKRADVEHS